MAQATTVVPHRRARRSSRRTREAPQPGSTPLPIAAGRAWINGREVGGPDPRFSHLDRSYD